MDCVDFRRSKLSVRTDLPVQFDFLPLPIHPFAYMYFEAGYIVGRINNENERVRNRRDQGETDAKQDCVSPFDLYNDEELHELCAVMARPFYKRRRKRSAP